MARVLVGFRGGFDLGDEYPDDFAGHDADNVTCKQCGATGLSWSHTGTRWRLIDAKGFHFCKAAAGDFDVIK